MPDDKHTINDLYQKTKYNIKTGIKILLFSLFCGIILVPLCVVTGSDILLLVILITSASAVPTIHTTIKVGKLINLNNIRNDFTKNESFYHNQDDINGALADDFANVTNGLSVKTKKQLKDAMPLDVAKVDGLSIAELELIKQNLQLMKKLAPVQQSEQEFKPFKLVRKKIK